MKVSFTGTRLGMNSVQKQLFTKIIGELGATEFYHGDCVGADADAHKIVVATKQDISVKKRPCNIDSQRAFTTEGECIADPEPPLVRNKKIVDDGEILVAIPGGQFEEIRSGTWSTVRYAKKNQKPIIIIWPNGHVLR